MINKTKKRLMNLLKYAQSNVPYYEEVLQDKNITIDTVEDIFYGLNFMKKAYIKKNYSNVISKELACEELSEIWNFETRNYDKDYNYELNNKNIVAEYTSGTTGTPLVVVKSDFERLILGKEMWKMRSRIGNNNAKDMFQFIHNSNGENPFEFYSDDYFEQKAEELKYLKKKNYKWWHIFPSMLEGYAYVAENKNIHMDNLIGIESNGAYMSSEEKSRYERIFDCKIADNYGCKEIWNIAYENEQGLLSINNDVIFELVDDNGNIIENYEEEGYIVITSLVLKNMPFIRYYLGDMAKYVKNVRTDGSEEKCIEVLPGRYKIYGTQEYGNRFFREITIDLIQQYNMKMIQSVYVVEKEPQKFIVNIAGCSQCHEEVKKNFVECLGMYQRIDSSNWNIDFTFEDDVKQKSMFVSLVK